MTANWSGTRTVVVGAGRSGLAASALLLELGAHVRLTDLNSPEPSDALSEVVAAGAEVFFGEHPGSLWEWADAVVASPGIAPTAPPLRAARAAGVEVVAEIELAAPMLDAPVIGITGSNGKSTVTQMVGAILAEAGLEPAVCGNIGVALSRVVLEQLRGQRRVDRYVVELSSFQTEAIERLHCQWAAVLNVTADHLDRHGTLDGYGLAKLAIARNSGADDWLIYGASDPWLAAHLPTNTLRAPFGMSETTGDAAAWADEEAIQWRPPQGPTERVLDRSELPLVGTHNVLNACAAVALGCLAGASSHDAAVALRAFAGLEHRMEPCGNLASMPCINDSKATNVGATLAAIQGLDRPLWLILGGRDKNADFAQLRHAVSRRVRRLLLVGEAAPRIAAALHGAAPMSHCHTIARAIEIAAAEGASNEVLLLAPACTSFDQYRDYEHRGRQFKHLIRAHAEGDAFDPGA